MHDKSVHGKTEKMFRYNYENMSFLISFSFKTVIKKSSRVGAVDARRL